MNYHGFRYITADQFSSYCNDLKVNLKPFHNDLEYFEKEGVLLPTARIIKPAEYLAARNQTDKISETFGQRLQEWEELESILPGRSDSVVHVLDLINPANNKYVSWPAVGSYRPWKEYRVKVTASDGESYLTGNAEHLYHYWQVYQVYELQLISNWNRGLGQIASSFFQNNKRFNALSFFIFSYQSEERIALDGRYFLSELSKAEFDRYSQVIKQHANLALEKFDVKTDELYDFLIYLLDCERKYRDREKYSLAKEIRKDIFGLVAFISHATEETFEQIQEALTQKGYYWLSKQLRHLDPSALVIDIAQEDLEHLLDDYNLVIAPFSLPLSKDDVKELLKFLDDRHILIIAHSIHFLVDLMNNSEPTWFASLYMGLSGLLVGFESYLIEVVKQKTLTASNPYLYNYLNALYKKEKWWRSFEITCAELKAKYKDDNLAALFDLTKNDSVGQVEKTFLIVYFARNLAFHRYMYQPEFYDDLYSPVYRSICFSLLYTWCYSSKIGLSS